MLTVSRDVSNIASANLLAEPTFGDCSNISVTPVKVPFTPGKQTLLSSLTSANFDGMAILTGDAVAAVEFTDPTDGKQKIRIPEPAGGWNWLTSGLTALPQTIYGVKVTSADISFIGCQKLAADVILTASNQGFGIGDIIINKDTINLATNN